MMSCYLDKTVQFYKSSALAQVASGRSTPARGFSLDVIRPNHEPKATTKDGKEAWEIAAEESLPESESFLFIFLSRPSVLEYIYMRSYWHVNVLIRC